MRRSKASSPVLLACDLDGTLLDAGGEPTPDVVDALADLRSIGAHIVPCTGRSVARMREAAARLGLQEGLAVCFHGAVIADVADGRWVRQLDVPHEAVVAALRLSGGQATAHVGEQVLEQAGPAAFESPLEKARGHVLVDDLAASVLGKRVTRVIVRPMSADTFTRAMRELRPGVSIVPAPAGRFAVHNAQASKLAGLRAVCTLLGVPRSAVVACGDCDDDVEVLRWAELGVAVGEASETVRAAADVVVARNELGRALRGLVTSKRGAPPSISRTRRG
jgi:hydroxymethylpyrimidine pyrophosphatase-like HAD family hydrolase